MVSFGRVGFSGVFRLRGAGNPRNNDLRRIPQAHSHSEHHNRKLALFKGQKANDK